MQLITDDQVRQTLGLAELTDALQDAMGALGRREASSSVRVRSASQGIMASALAATWPDGGVVGGKLYATKDGAFTFVIALFDLEGTLIGLIEGDHLTRLRTAAGTGVALRHLLYEAPTVATIVGTGRQCSGHLEMLAQELPTLDEVRIVGRRVEGIAAALADAKRLGLKAVSLDDAGIAVEGAGLVITLTNSEQPLFPADRLDPNAMVCALGATKADRVEIGPDVTARATRVVVDDLTGSRIECGDLLAAEAAGVFSWGEAEALATVVAAGKDQARAKGGITLFESQGIALQDLVGGALVLQQLDQTSNG